MEPVKRRKVEDEEEKTEVEDKLEEERTLSSDDEEEEEEERQCYGESDSEDYENPEYLDYLAKIRESRCFYVPPLPASVKITPWIAPITNLEPMRRHAEEAIKFYNEKHGTGYVFDCVVRANFTSHGGILFYVTFKATTTDPADSAVRITHEFEARVHQPLVYDIYNVLDCSLKTIPELKGDEQSSYTHP